MPRWASLKVLKAKLNNGTPRSRGKSRGPQIRTEHTREYDRFIESGDTLATLRWHIGGRPRKLSPKDLKTVRALLRSGDVSVCTIVAQFRVSRSTLYR